MSSKKTDMEIIMEISELAQMVGWHIAVPLDNQDPDNGKVPGLVMGNEEFIAEMMQNYQYELYSMEENETGTLEDPERKGTLH